jgi:hypothetical protein
MMVRKRHERQAASSRHGGELLQEGFSVRQPVDELVAGVCRQESPRPERNETGQRGSGVGSAMVAAVMYPRYAAGPIVESRRENATESLLRS